MNLDTTKPPRASDLDWTTIDPLHAMTLGKALAQKGYVLWIREQVQWAVISPTQSGRHEMVHKTYPEDRRAVWWEMLICTCPNGSNPEGPCVHKCAVHAHATVLSEYRFYVEG